MFGKLANATATIYEEVVTGSADDGMGGTTETTTWDPVHEDVDVGFDPETLFRWAQVEGESESVAARSSARALYVPEPAADAADPGAMVDVTYRGETNRYRIGRSRVITGPTGAHAEAVLVDANDDIEP